MQLTNRKIFKTLIDQATSSNLMSYLFVRDVMTQSLRFEFAKIWKHIHSELIEILDFVDSKCSTFVKSFLSSNERTSEENDETRSHHIRDDFSHHFAQFSFFDFMTKSNALKLKVRINLIKLSFQHSFLQSFTNAYLRKYNMRVIKFDFKSSKWYRRLTYIDR